jgi:Tfp pilus assembly protein PilF
MTIPDMDRIAKMAPLRWTSMAMRLSSAALFVCLGACSTPQAPGGSAGSSAAPASAASVPASAEGRQAATTPAEPVAAPVAAMTAQEVQRSMSSALDHLQAGQEEQAEAELTRILHSDPNNRLATSLLRQIKDDPVASLGRESFAYRVQPGESLSRIAQRFLNDLHLFYILARYNNIKVPRNLAGGQMIRVPGKAPAAASSSPTPAAAAPAAPSPPAATVTTPPSPAADTDAAAASRVARQRSEAVARHSRAARAAFAKQDLDAAIKSWDAVLEIDPDNRTAQLERQKVVGLKEKLGKVK